MPMRQHLSNLGRPSKPRVMASTLSLAGLVAARIRKLRTTAQALSRKAGVNPSIISKILNGKQAAAEPDTVDRLVRAMGITLEQFHRARRNSRTSAPESSQSAKAE